MGHPEMLALQQTIIAHRGASAYAPENTFAAFNKARDLGAAFIEFDLICSQEGEPFIFHDDRLERTSNGQGFLGQAEASYLNSLDAGSWFSQAFAGEPIPHFKEMIAWLSLYDMQANIEIKPFSGTAEQTALTVCHYIQQYWPKQKDLPLISSFDFEALLLCQRIAPNLPLGLLLDRWDAQWSLKAQELACFSVHLNQAALSASRARAIKDQGYTLCAYTANQASLAKTLFGWGVDAVFSDYPDLLRL